MPAEHGLPLADVDVRAGDALYLQAAEALLKQRLDLYQVPRDALVEETAGDICTVKR